MTTAVVPNIALIRACEYIRSSGVLIGGSTNQRQRKNAPHQRNTPTAMRNIFSPAHKRERGSVARLHALGLPERRRTAQRVAGASGGTPPGSETSGSLSTAM